MFCLVADGQVHCRPPLSIFPLVVIQATTFGWTLNLPTAQGIAVAVNNNTHIICFGLLLSSISSFRAVPDSLVEDEWHSRKSPRLFSSYCFQMSHSPGYSTIARYITTHATAIQRRMTFSPHHTHNKRIIKTTCTYLHTLPLPSLDSKSNHAQELHRVQCCSIAGSPAPVLRCKSVCLVLFQGLSEG